MQIMIVAVRHVVKCFSDNTVSVLILEYSKIDGSKKRIFIRQVSNL